MLYVVGYISDTTKMSGQQVDQMPELVKAVKDHSMDLR